MFEEREGTMGRCEENIVIISFLRRQERPAGPCVLYHPIVATSEAFGDELT